MPLADIKVKSLTPEKLATVKKLRKQIVEKSKATPAEGTAVEYLGKTFIVYPGVFHPMSDSKPLVENFVINKGEAVLDIGTGCGVIAVFAALKGAGKVIALDINPEAVRTAKENARQHGVGDIVEVRLSDGLHSLAPNERFDVITANLPFTDDDAEDMVEQSIYDPGFNTHRQFFSRISNYLAKTGRVYLSQANFGNVKGVLRLARENELNARLIGKEDLPNDPRIFYALELRHG